MILVKIPEDVNQALNDYLDAETTADPEELADWEKAAPTIASTQRLEKAYSRVFRQKFNQNHDERGRFASGGGGGAGKQVGLTMVTLAQYFPNHQITAEQLSRMTGFTELDKKGLTNAVAHAAGSEETENRRRYASVSSAINRALFVHPMATSIKLNATQEEVARVEGVAATTPPPVLPTSDLPPTQPLPETPLLSINNQIEKAVYNGEDVPSSDVAIASNGALSTYVVSSVQSDWGTSSSQGQSIILQKAVSDEFSVPFTGKAAESYQEKFAPGAPNQMTPPTSLSEMKDFVRAQYAVTQQWLTDQHIDAVPVYRGAFYGDGTHEPPPELAAMTPGSETELTISQGALRSWTTKQSTADQFTTNEYYTAGDDKSGTGYLFKAMVPKERILGLWATGLGTGIENEVAIIGGPALPMTVGRVHDHHNPFA